MIMAAIMAIPAFADKDVEVKPTMTLKLYPYGQKINVGIVENGVSVTQGPLENNGLGNMQVADEYGGLVNVGDDACIDIYLPEKPNGKMVVICPGGAYGYLASWHEGSYVADWMLKHGVAACVVKYRMPQGHWSIPLHDVQNAFRYCRAHSAEWGIDKIGVIGFSAGGHLACSASTLFVDDATRPDFSILVYPVISMKADVTHDGTRDNLLGVASNWSSNPAKYNSLLEYYSLENRVTKDTPPTLLALSADDGLVPPKNSLLYFEALKANGVWAEMYLYPVGGHGWGFREEPYGGDTLGSQYRQQFYLSLEVFLNAL